MARLARPRQLQRYGFGAFAAVIAAGAMYTVSALTSDLIRTPSDANFLVFILLGLTLLNALGFEFVNGFHDNANAVATVIYTHSLPAYVDLAWSGFFNFLGVMLSTGAIAFGIISPRFRSA